MTGIRFMLVGILVTLIVLGAAVSPVYARMGGHGSGENSKVILGQMGDVIAKYNGNHSGLMQAFSGEFGDTFYILVKKSFLSRSKYVYEAQIDSQGYVTLTEVRRSGMRMGMGMGRHGSGGGSGYDCDSNLCITTTKDDVNTAYDYLMANSKDYITLNDVYDELSTMLLTTWGLNLGIFDDVMSWIVDEYLDEDFD